MGTATGRKPAMPGIPVCKSRKGTRTPWFASFSRCPVPTGWSRPRANAAADATVARLQSAAAYSCTAGCSGVSPSISSSTAAIRASFENGFASTLDAPRSFAVWR